jgi:hypothetical protein
MRIAAAIRNIRAAVGETVVMIIADTPETGEDYMKIAVPRALSGRRLL